MNFNHDTFATQIKNTSGISCSSTSWSQWNNTKGNLNTVLNYSEGSDDFCTWYQETSTWTDRASSKDAGMMVSCKIDFKRGTGDDHIILLACFMNTSSGPQMKFAQASVQFHGSEQNNIVGTPVTSGDMGQGIYNSLSAILNDDFGSVDDSTDGRKKLPGIAQINVNAMLRSVS